MEGIFHKLGIKLFYHRKENGIELDFLASDGLRCIPIEIKSTNGNSKSLKTVLNNPDKYHVEKAIKFGDVNIGCSDRLFTFPLYLAAWVLRGV